MTQVLKFKELSFLIYGLGLSGQSVIKFFKKKRIKNFKVWDDKKRNLYKNLRAKNLKKALKEANYIVLAPGITLKKNKYLKGYQRKIITDIDLYYLFYPKIKSIVVTGTNGKSTTCKLLEHLLKKNNFNCIVGGNIGTPILSLKTQKKKFIIIEASSFQLSHSKFVSPDFAFFLNFSNDHLDWHGNLKNYFNSKLKIFRLQNKSQFALVNKKFKKHYRVKKFFGKLIIPKMDNYKKIKSEIKNNDYVVSDINDENMSFVYAFSKILKIRKKSFIHAMKSFKGLPHRFEIFLKRKNITFINDSKATTFRATQVALNSLKNIYLIMGGLPKKNDKVHLNKYKRNIKKCYLIGKNISFFKNQIKKNIILVISKNLKNSVMQIFKDLQAEKDTNKYILLSPAAASFDQFKNFENRGEEFKRLCKIYAKKYI